MKLFALSFLLIALSGCALFKKEAPNTNPVTVNKTAGVSVQQSGNEMIFRREKEKQIVSAFHKLNEVRFFSAENAPVILAATRESGFPGWTLILFQFSGKEKDSFAVFPEVVDPMKEKGTKYIVSGVSGIAPDGKSVRLVIDGKNAVFHFDSKKVVF